jgi:hypothetical protein
MDDTRKFRHAARRAVGHAIVAGKLSPASSRVCSDCGAGAAEYDHVNGYEPERHLDVEPVCKPCHLARRVARGENARGENHWQAKLTEEQVRLIRELAAMEYTHEELGEMYGVARAHITLIVNRKRWAHVA